MRGGERETFAAAVHSLAKGQQSTHKKDTLQCHKFETDKTIENWLVGKERNRETN